MKVIGLTGGYCVGKNQYAAEFAARGVPVIDVDELGHEILDECKEDVVARFGPAIRDERGSIDRKRLGAIVFGSDSLSDLESILHPHMVRRCVELIEDYRESSSKAVIVNAALLHRMHLDVLCDEVCFITANLLVRYLRCKKRDGLTIRAFIRRINAQKDIKSTLVESASHVYVMDNSCHRGIIHRQVDELCVTIGLDYDR